MMHRCISFPILIVGLLCCSISSAHHWVDPKAFTPVEFTGTIVFVSWDGAHAMYRIRSENARHEEVQWEVLGASPKILAARKIYKSTFKPGDRVTVSGFIDAASTFIAPEFFTTADGRKFQLGFYPPSMVRPPQDK